MRSFYLVAMLIRLSIKITVLIMTLSYHEIRYVYSKTADSDTVSTYQVSSVQLVTDKKLEAFNKA